MSDILNPIKSLPDVSFIDELTLEQSLAQMISDYEYKYEEITGSKAKLSKADPNRLILYACAVQQYQALQSVDRAGKQDLLKYSYDSFLDNLAALKGVVRNNAKSATVIVRFVLSDTRTSATTIPQGTRVAVGDIFFESLEVAEIPAGEWYADINMTCTQVGKIGNGYLAGEINSLVDPIGYINSVSNVIESGGGSEIETDESLAERTFLAPSSYSVGGPEDAYIYWVKTFSQDIADVKPTNPFPGVVDIRFILKDGELPNEKMINDLKDFLMNNEKRPMTDNVVINVPEIIEYQIDVKYWVDKSDSARAVNIQKEVERAVNSYTLWQNSVIGRDINPSKLNELMMLAGAKRVEITNPTYFKVTEISIARLATPNNLIYGGIE